jgi:hypothetical protein
MSGLNAEAPVLQAPAPDMSVISDTTTDGVRSLNLRIKSARQAPFIMVSLNPEIKVRAFAIDGKRYDKINRNNWVIRYIVPPPEGIELALELEQPLNLVLRVTDQSYGLPQPPGTPSKTWPDYSMPWDHLFNNGFVVTKTFAL